MRGWKTNEGSSNSYVREKCMSLLNIDILGVAETHLTAREELNLKRYLWFGRNRKSNMKAWTGSGGVGFLVHERLAHLYTITIRDNSHEDILWLHFKDKNTSEAFHMCLLPPTNRIII